MDCRATFSDLRCREVINLCDGMRMGFVSDLKLDLKCGRVLALIVPGKGGVLGFLERGEDFVIPWDCVEKIGDDIIFVKFETDCCRRPKEKKGFLC